MEHVSRKVGQGATTKVKDTKLQQILEIMFTERVYAAVGQVESLQFGEDVEGGDVQEGQGHAGHVQS